LVGRKDLFTTDNSTQPQVNLDYERQQISSISGSAYNNEGQMTPIAHSSSRNMGVGAKALTAVVAQSHDDINFRQSAQKKENEALQRMMTMGSPVERQN
jgi:hypothetical protein